MTSTAEQSAQDQFDYVVIGAGPVGETFGQKIAAAGHSVAIVEHDLVGGDCAYFACKPSKALLRPVQVAQDSQHVSGVASSKVLPDDLIARRDLQVGDYDDGPQIHALERAGLTVVRGHGRLAGQRAVAVDTPDETTRIVQATKGVVITSGTTANIPPAFEGVPVWDSKDATAVREVPRRLLVVGGGPVACEAATWMNALGSEVTMLVRGGELLAGYEPFVSDLLAEALTEAGVDIRFHTEATQVHRPDGLETGLGEINGGIITVRTNTAETFEAEELLLATGRRPNLEPLKLSSVDLTADDVLEDRTPDWLYALGDASGTYRLTHMGKFQARQLVARLTQGNTADESQDEPPTPQVVFTDPQIAVVGLTQAEAQQAGYAVVTAEADFSNVVGATLLRDDVAGKAKFVVDRATNCLIGATLMGPETGEMLHAATIAIAGKVPIETLTRAVPVFPTASEVWLFLLEQLSD